MNQSICGADCSLCPYGEQKICKGCTESNGRPFGNQCFVYNCIQTGGIDSYRLFQKQLIEEFNRLHIPGMPEVRSLNPLAGSFVNLEYPLPNGQTARFLDDKDIYLGNQLESAFGGGRCYGIVGGRDFLLVCTYSENGTDPELMLYKKR